MANKPQGKSWSEIQLTIATLAITATIGFWNLFSTPEKAQAGAKVTQTATPPPPPTETAEPTATTALALRPVKIIFGGQAPQQTVVQVQAQGSTQNTTKKRRTNDGSNSSGGGSAPSQPPSTGSSKP